MKLISLSMFEKLHVATFSRLYRITIKKDLWKRQSSVMISGITNRTVSIFRGNTWLHDVRNKEDYSRIHIISKVKFTVSLPLIEKK